MTQPDHIGISEAVFKRIARAYCDCHECALSACRPDGSLLWSNGKHKLANSDEWRLARAYTIAESLRWGHPAIYDQPEDYLLWAIPLMINAAVVGGLVAWVPADAIIPDDDQPPRSNLSEATYDLRIIAEAENLTNSHYLAEQRAEYERQRLRAQAIHSAKAVYSENILEVYLREEKRLVQAIQDGRQGEARALVNNILISVYNHGHGDLDLTKSFALELVVIMVRTALDTGGTPQELLGSHFSNLTKLGEAESEEELSAWIVGMLGRIFDAIKRPDAERSNRALLNRALDYIRKHHTRSLSRDEVARVVHMSPSHFSRQLKEITGRNFTDHLTQFRLDHSRELLRNTDKSLVQIAMEAGFNDQSYFTKVFKKIIGRTPKEYLKNTRSSYGKTS